MELAADISGVCSVAGTLLITSKPTQRLSTKMTRSVSSAVDTGGTSSGIDVLARGGTLLARGHPGPHGQGGVNHPALVSDHDAALQVVGQVDGQRAILHQVQQQGADVARVHR